MNILLILIICLIFILAVITIIDKYTLLISDNNIDNDYNDYNYNNKNYKNYKNYKNDDKDEYKNDDIIKDDKIFIKYSSINNKLITIDDYINLHHFINEIKSSIYISEINSNNKNNIIEMISNDIQKTKLKYNFNKLKNIFIIVKKIEESIKIVIFYDGLIHNLQHFKFIENDYSGYTIVYKLNLKNKLFNHYLQ
jgi:hypothetical protein